MGGEGSPGLYSNCLEVPDRRLGVANAVFDVGLEAAPDRIIVGLVPLVLQVREEAREAPHPLRKRAYLVAPAARSLSLAMFECPVRSSPRRGLRLRLADQRVRAALGQTVEQGVVDGAQRPPQVGFEGAAASGRKLSLGRGQEVRGLQDASLPLPPS